MPSCNVAVVLGLCASVLAVPNPVARLLNKRQTLTSFNDVDILNYALTLEHLEATFYREGLAKFTGADFTAAGFSQSSYDRLKEVAAHEAAHVDFLSTALGSAATKECTYAFPMSSVAEFLATASVLEGVGVSAYLGAARQIANKDYLTAAGSILTVESRHSAYLRDTSSQEKLSPFPSAQDVGLSPNAPFPALASGATGPVAAGQTVQLKTDGAKLVMGTSTAKLYAAFITAGEPVYADLVEAGDGMTFSITVPQGVAGQSYLVLCNCKERVDDSTIVAGPAIIEVTA
ncbi:hypothetical protein KC315_g15031 [Hortaea werneckii]|nr:hypothetical protein KC315_g15031 [Hortaea werneckii]KAI7535204.1 hypothetical protein KC331_g12152 [Hortaea werneckii]KAI7707704.1 hypothetical protein KC353_g11486 [Hortaea werneckii]